MTEGEQLDFVPTHRFPYTGKRRSATPRKKKKIRGAERHTSELEGEKNSRRAQGLK